MYCLLPTTHFYTEIHTPRNHTHLDHHTLPHTAAHNVTAAITGRLPTNRSRCNPHTSARSNPDTPVCSVRDPPSTPPWCSMALGAPTGPPVSRGGLPPGGWLPPSLSRPYPTLLRRGPDGPPTPGRRSRLATPPLRMGGMSMARSCPSRTTWRATGRGSGSGRQPSNGRVGRGKDRECGSWVRNVRLGLAWSVVGGEASVVVGSVGADDGCVAMGLSGRGPNGKKLCVGGWGGMWSYGSTTCNAATQRHTFHDQHDDI